jgi:hypothetical protein
MDNPARMCPYCVRRTVPPQRSSDEPFVSLLKAIKSSTAKDDCDREQVLIRSSLLDCLVFKCHCDAKVRVT